MRKIQKYFFMIILTCCVLSLIIPFIHNNITEVKADTIPSQTTTVTSTNSKVVGYYAAWSRYSGYSPSKIDASKLTHINYAFANISSTNKAILGYPDIDVSNINQLNKLKITNPKLKTLISIGGWSWSKRFSDVALTEASRTTFANSCVNLITKYGFNGIDIDWEFPVSGGMPTNKRRPADKQNFTLLMKKIREKLNAKGKIDGKHYLLTFAGAAGNEYIKNTELSKLSQYVDYVNIMTYDFHGPWDSYTGFNAPLYSNTSSSGSINSSINNWINAGFPRSKIVMGIPFYGYVYKNVANANKGLNQRYSSATSMSYENIAARYLNKPGYTRYFHSKSMVPWIFNGSTFITYDDTQSIARKANYIKDKKLGGAMIWELSQDPNKKLLNSLYTNLK